MAIAVWADQQRVPPRVEIAPGAPVGGKMTDGGVLYLTRSDYAELRDWAHAQGPHMPYPSRGVPHSA